MSDQASGFDPEALDDPGFKEDSVREEITHPLLVRLGYASSGDSKIIRSKNLSNPFVMIGTTKRAITQIPDYLLSVEDKYRWVLDAKAPGETITSGKHVEQAYSYAIHPEIRVDLLLLAMGDSSFSLTLATERLSWISNYAILRTIGASCTES